MLKFTIDCTLLNKIEITVGCNLETAVWKSMVIPNDPQDHLVGGKLFPIAILLMNVAEDMEGVRGQRKLAYLYFLEYHFFLEYAGFPLC